MFFLPDALACCVRFHYFLRRDFGRAGDLPALGRGDGVNGAAAPPLSARLPSCAGLSGMPYYGFVGACIIFLRACHFSGWCCLPGKLAVPPAAVTTFYAFALACLHRTSCVPRLGLFAVGYIHYPLSIHCWNRNCRGALRVLGSFCHAMLTEL